MKKVAVIPAFNEADRLPDVISRTILEVDLVVVVDDGSTDDSTVVAKKAGAMVVRHPMNLGKGAACRTGFYAALELNADLVITLDADGQHDPRFIRMLEEKAIAANGPCIVLGNRMNNTTPMPWIRWGTNRALSGLISFLAGQTILDSQCGFRLIHRSVLEEVDFINNHFDAESEILVRAARKGFPICEVDIPTIYGDEYSKIHKFWDTLRFAKFFFRHLFHTPVLRNTPERKVAMKLREETARLTGNLEGQVASIPSAVGTES